MWIQAIDKATVPQGLIESLEFVAYGLYSVEHHMIDSGYNYSFRDATLLENENNIEEILHFRKTASESVALGHNND